MKIINKHKIIGIFALMFTIISCSDEAPIASKVTDYAILTFNGDGLMVINEGTPYTEEGAVAHAGDKELEVETSGTVNSNKPGVYKVNYSAINADGFPSSITRTIVVLSTAPSAINLEGTFFRNSNANNITRISDREYVCDNAGGLTRVLPADKKNLVKLTFYNIDDTQVYAPPQTGTSESGISAETSVGTIVNENSFNWVLYASSVYGLAVRNFTR